MVHIKRSETPPDLQAKRAKTQWSAQFLAASELARRGFTVAFTMGNHTPVADMMVGTPDGAHQFWVDVKGQSGRNGWIVRRKARRKDLYYILVYVGGERGQDRFYVLSQKETDFLSKRFKLDALRRSSKNQHKLGDGFPWLYAEPYLNSWTKLPRSLLAKAGGMTQAFLKEFDEFF